MGFKTGYLGEELRIKNDVLSKIGDQNADVIWVDNGELIGRSLAVELRARCQFLINHNLDNPFTARDGRRWRLFMNALPYYDLFVTPRLSSQQAASASGARRAIVVCQAADEIVHRRRELSEGEQMDFRSEVAFVGTWMPERGPFMKRLIERGVPLRIFGTRWKRSKEYDVLSSIITSADLGDDEYPKAISGAKIALCQLSLGNADLHTTRSLEIPAIGTLLCAPRTSDHESLYRDNLEACFFSNADECADICLALLSNDERRISISGAGHLRAIKNNRFNEAVASEILSYAR